MPANPFPQNTAPSQRDSEEISLKKILKVLDEAKSGTTPLKVSGSTVTLAQVSDMSADARTLNAKTTAQMAAQLGVAWEAKSANFNAVARGKYLCDTTSAAFTATLPASPSVGDTVDIVDAQGTFDSNNLTIARNGKKIGGSASDLVCNTEHASITLIYVGGALEWQVVRNQ